MKARDDQKNRRLLATMTNEPFQPVRLYYAIPDESFVIERLRRLGCVAEASHERCWQWLYHAEAGALRFAGGEYGDVPKERRPIVLGRIRFPKHGRMTFETNSIERAIVGARFFAPRFGPEVVAMRCRMVNRWFAADEGDPHELMGVLDRDVTVIDPREAEAELIRDLAGARSPEDAQRAMAERMKRRLESGEDVPAVEDFPLAPEEETPEFERLATALEFRLMRALEHWNGNTHLTLSAIIERTVRAGERRCKHGEAAAMNLDPGSPRQLGEEGLLVLWRDGCEPGQREGFACVLSMCPHPGCACEDVYVDGFVIDGRARAISWQEDRLCVSWPAGADSAQATPTAKLVAIVDPESGETRAHPDLPEATDPALLSWLVSEMDGELLDLLHRFRARAKGYPPERPMPTIEIDACQAGPVYEYEELFDGARSDEYVLAGCRYWTLMFFCLDPDCLCHLVRVGFAAEESEDGDTVGSVLVKLRGGVGFKVQEIVAECGAPEHLVRELWARFVRRHDVLSFLWGREARARQVGATLWREAAEEKRGASMPAAVSSQPVRVTPKPGRNDPCPCGSGRKYKKCCIDKRP